MITVGIPRALLYYSYFPLWKRVLTGAGAAVVVSPPTNETILNLGVRATVDEVCAPVKVAVGHTLFLQDRVDLLLVPRLVSVEPRAYICPKLMGLPDMLKHSVKGIPEILDPDIDLSKGTLAVLNPLRSLSRRLSCPLWSLVKSFRQALGEQRRAEIKLMSGILPEDAFGQDAGVLRKTRHKGPRIAVLGHPYNVYDPLLSMNIIEKLHEYEIDVATAEMLPVDLVNQGLKVLPKELFWTLSKRVLGAGLYYLQAGDAVDGIILISSFGCGLESLIADLLERHARRKGFPFMHLTTDEHTAEAGMLTRLEAFVDMINLRRRQAVL